MNLHCGSPAVVIFKIINDLRVASIGQWLAWFVLNEMMSEDTSTCAYLPFLYMDGKLAIGE